MEWVGDQLADLEGLLKQAGAGGTPADAADAQSLRDCLPEVLEALGRLIDRVQAANWAARPPRARWPTSALAGCSPAGTVAAARSCLLVGPAR